MQLDSRARWIALYVLCLGDLMIVLDATIVNVALPSIKTSLGFSEASLAWVVNAYLLTFGGFLLLGGRLGDLFGQRRIFLSGLGFFTAASAVCGLADSQEALVIARAFQGLGGAVVSAVALSILMTLFTTPGERAKAMGIFGFVMAGGGTAGVILGGVITNFLSWHWVFLVNLPVGAAVFLLSLRLLPAEKAALASGKKSLDLAGAITVTTSLIVATYGIINGNHLGWLSTQTLGFLIGGGALFLLFLLIETRAANPLMPLSIFRIRNVATANIVEALYAVGLLGSFFLVALYLQQVLGYDPLEVGLSYLPFTLPWCVISLQYSGKIVMRYGIKTPAIAGLLCFAVGVFLFMRAPVDGNFLVDVLPAMILQGVGLGVASNPVLLAATSDVRPDQSGLASGLVNTSFMMGGAIGLAILTSVAATHTNDLTAAGTNGLEALTSGYHLAFLLGGIFTLLAAAACLRLIQSPRQIAQEVDSTADDFDAVTTNY